MPPIEYETVVEAQKLLNAMPKDFKPDCPECGHCARVIHYWAKGKYKCNQCKRVF